MAPLTREIPGFYYDPEKNRYFPLGPLNSPRLASQTPKQEVGPSNIAAHPKGSSTVRLIQSPATQAASKRRKTAGLGDKSFLPKVVGKASIERAEIDDEQGSGVILTSASSLRRAGILHPLYTERDRYFQCVSPVMPSNPRRPLSSAKLVLP